jgi:prepilin-type N-terminal cleavage/methylation domain-containing protein
MITITRHRLVRRGSFTLVELLIVMLIVSILAALSLTALSAAAQEGKRQRVKLQIAKIDALIMEKWNSYRFRQLPIRLPANTTPRVAARTRLLALRELMRLELPDRMTDILYIDTGADATVKILPSRPALSVRYKQLADSQLTLTGATYSNLRNENAECLYLILSQMKDGDRSALSFFFESEIGDEDADGLKEILDPWGTPIVFLRWAPGYSVGIPDWTTAPYGESAAYFVRYEPATAQNVDSQQYPDPFDPLKADRRLDPNDTAYSFNPKMNPFALKPLIVSSGPDKFDDIVKGYYGGTFSYSATNFGGGSPYPNDPYYIQLDSGRPAPWIGACGDTNRDDEAGRNVLNYADNITNHALALEGQ